MTFQTPNTIDSAAFNVTNGQSDYDVRTNVAAAFSNVKVYKRLELRVDGDITLKLNKTTNPGIAIGKLDSPYVIPFDMDVTDLYISNASGATVAVKLFGTA